MTVTGSEVLLKLVKAAPGVWPRLTHGNQKTVHISIDFNRWEDKEFGILGGTYMYVENTLSQQQKLASFRDFDEIVARILHFSEPHADFAKVFCHKFLVEHFFYCSE
jgi:hypothetical protein